MKYNNNSENEKVYYSEKEFLSDKYSKLAAIQGFCSVETTIDEEKPTWVWTNAQFEMGDGTRSVSFEFNVDGKEYEPSLERLSKIIEIATNLRYAIIEMKKDYDILVVEIEKNRKEDGDKVQDIKAGL